MSVRVTEPMHSVSAGFPLWFIVAVCWESGNHELMTPGSLLWPYVDPIHVFMDLKVCTKYVV